jgi:predicted ABC-type transport system involved in lysophospholipase L1 biosynthesis ATPase subunit
MRPSASGKSTLLQCNAGLDALTAGKAFIGADLSALDDDPLTIRVPAGHTVDILLAVSNPPKQSRVMFSFDVRRSA